MCRYVGSTRARHPSLDEATLDGVRGRREVWTRPSDRPPSLRDPRADVGESITASYREVLQSLEVDNVTPAIAPAITEARSCVGAGPKLRSFAGVVPLNVASRIVCSRLVAPRRGRQVTGTRGRGGAVVELVFDSEEVLGGVRAQLGDLREVIAQGAVRVLIGPVLPGRS